MACKSNGFACGRLDSSYGWLIGDNMKTMSTKRFIWLSDLPLAISPTKFIWYSDLPINNIWPSNFLVEVHKIN